MFQSIHRNTMYNKEKLEIEAVLKKRKVFEEKFSPPHKKIHEGEHCEFIDSGQIKDTTYKTFVQIDNPVKIMSSPQNTQSLSAIQSSGSGSSQINILSKTMVVPNNKTEENFREFLDLEFDNWDDEFTEIPADFSLDLTKPCHCKILSISNLISKIILTLSSTIDQQRAVCNLEGFWIYINLKVHDNLYLTAKNIEGTWVVNNEHGLIVFEPDVLLSSTAVVGSLWCKRKSVLSERFRGFDSTNQAMLVGSLVHNIFQYALANNVFGRRELEQTANKFIHTNRVIKCLYECEISLKTLEEEILKYIPKIQEFLKCYIGSGSNSQALIKDNWKGKIETVEDIEENIWCPELGIKGKIDLTIKGNQQIMPLELKTGRATVSLEHRGQVMMYLMMMKNVGYKVTSGLLLYLKESILREIPAAQNEERHLIYLRNELVYYLTKTPEIKENNLILPPELPEPINHPGCGKCPCQNICAVYAHVAQEDISSKKHLKSIQQAILEYCSQSHIDYFIKWTCLLIVEGAFKSDSKHSKDIYLVAPEEREANGRCIYNLNITELSNESDDMVKHTFKKKGNSNHNFLKSGIVNNNYVVISTARRYAIAAGYVINISSNSISVICERNLCKRYPNQIFVIDSFDSSMTQTFQFSSLSLLLENTPKADNLRKIIIDKVSPTFKLTLPKIIGSKGKNILKRLNIIQQRAVLKAITANEYFLIKGMPGTGKTATIVALIQLLYELGKTILITSHTNSAVDNVCLKLVQYGVKLLRLGSESKIHKDLWKYSEHFLTKTCSTPEEYEAVYHSAQIIAVTCFASGHPVLSKRSLDICIVDESTQVLQSSVIRPLYACKTFILIGDPDQLPAVIKNVKARDMGMNESLFERLYRPDATIALNINYRMNKMITNCANCLTYNGELKVANESVENATVSVNIKSLEDIYGKSSWILNVLDNTLEKSVQFLDTGPVWNIPQNPKWRINKSYNTDSQGDHNSSVNVHEAAVIYKIIQALIKGDVDPQNIGVIASYRHQVEQLTAILDKNSIDINTVDQFQGKDKSVIIYSCANSRDTLMFKIPKQHDILEDKRRINVAITRAKHKLILVGDVKTLLVYSTFKKLLSFFENNVIKLYECKDFLWTNVLDLDSY